MHTATNHHRHPEAPALTSAFTRVLTRYRRASKDDRPPPVPLAPAVAPSGPSPFEARPRGRAPQGDGESGSLAASTVSLIGKCSRCSLPRDRLLGKVLSSA